MDKCARCGRGETAGGDAVAEYYTPADEHVFAHADCADQTWELA